MITTFKVRVIHQNVEASYLFPILNFGAIDHFDSDLEAIANPKNILKLFKNIQKFDIEYVKARTKFWFEKKVDR